MTAHVMFIKFYIVLKTKNVNSRLSFGIVICSHKKEKCKLSLKILLLDKKKIFTSIFQSLKIDLLI